MARTSPTKTKKESNRATVGSEQKLWQAADALRNNMDAAEYKHVVLGLIFLKYISDTFEAKHAELVTQKAQGADPAIQGIDAQIAHGDTLHNDKHPDLKADYALANPPFNDSDWRGNLLEDDNRWVYGVPPSDNANFAWVQHFPNQLTA